MLNDSWPWWKIILQLGHSGDRVLPQSLLVLRQVILLDFLPVKWDKSSLIAMLGFSFLFFSLSPDPCTLDGFELIHLEKKKKKKSNACSRSTQTDLIEKSRELQSLAPVSTGRRGWIESLTDGHSLKAVEMFFLGSWNLAEWCLSPEPFWAQLQPLLMQAILSAHSFPSWSGLVVAWIMKGNVTSELYKCRLPLSPHTQQTPDFLGRSVTKMQEDLPVPSPVFSMQ